MQPTKKFGDLPKGTLFVSADPYCVDNPSRDGPIWLKLDNQKAIVMDDRGDAKVITDWVANIESLSPIWEYTDDDAPDCNAQYIANEFVKLGNVVAALKAEVLAWRSLVGVDSVRWGFTRQELNRKIEETDKWTDVTI